MPGPKNRSSVQKKKEEDEPVVVVPCEFPENRTILWEICQWCFRWVHLSREAEKNGDLQRWWKWSGFGEIDREKLSCKIIVRSSTGETMDFGPAGAMRTVCKVCGAGYCSVECQLKDISHPKRCWYFSRDIWDETCQVVPMPQYDIVAVDVEEPAKKPLKSNIRKRTKSTTIVQPSPPPATDEGNVLDTVCKRQHGIRARKRIPHAGILVHAEDPMVTVPLYHQHLPSLFVDASPSAKDDDDDGDDGGDADKKECNGVEEESVMDRRVRRYVQRTAMTTLNERLPIFLQGFFLRTLNRADPIEKTVMIEHEVRVELETGWYETERLLRGMNIRMSNEATDSTALLKYVFDLCEYDTSQLDPFVTSSLADASDLVKLRITRYDVRRAINMIRLLQMRSQPFCSRQRRYLEIGHPLSDGDQKELPLFCVLGDRLQLFNHSCEPNLQLIFLAGRVELRSLRPISAGEELVFHYLRLPVLHYAPIVRMTLDRRELGFSCRCPACTKSRMTCSHFRIPDPWRWFLWFSAPMMHSAMSSSPLHTRPLKRFSDKAIAAMALTHWHDMLKAATVTAKSHLWPYRWPRTPNTWSDELFARWSNLPCSCMRSNPKLVSCPFRDLDHDTSEKWSDREFRAQARNFCMSLWQRIFRRVRSSDEWNRIVTDFGMPAAMHILRRLQRSMVCTDPYLSDDLIPIEGDEDDDECEDPTLSDDDDSTGLWFHLRRWSRRLYRAFDRPAQAELHDLSTIRLGPGLKSYDRRSMFGALTPIYDALIELFAVVRATYSTQDTISSLVTPFRPDFWSRQMSAQKSLEYAATRSQWAPAHHLTRSSVLRRSEKDKDVGITTTATTTLLPESLIERRRSVMMRLVTAIHRLWPFYRASDYILIDQVGPEAKRLRGLLSLLTLQEEPLFIPQPDDEDDDDKNPSSKEDHDDDDEMRAVYMKQLDEYRKLSIALMFLSPLGKRCETSAMDAGDRSPCALALTAQFVLHTEMVQHERNLAPVKRCLAQ